jgi:DNA repair protein RadD
MSKIRLRSYQKEAIQASISFLKNKNGNGVIALPTGTGKSLIIAGLVRYYSVERNKRILVLTHVKELIEQNVKSTTSFCPKNKINIGVYSAGLNRREIAGDTLFCGIASIRNRVNALGVFDLVLIDECHLVPDNRDTMYVAVLNKLKKLNPNIRVIGLSATPYRLNSGLLTNGKIFDTIFYDKTSRDEFNWFVDNGYLAPLITKQTTQQLDIKGVHKRGGEFIQKELQAAVDKLAITQAAVAEIVALASDRSHWLIFSTGVDHNAHIVAALRRCGIASEAIDHTCTAKERDYKLSAFKCGDIRAVVNANILTTGFDFPGIDMIGVLCPMCSPGKWVQSLGRGTRPFKLKENCLVLDFAGNTRRLGPINDVVLPHKKRGTGRGSAPIKKCIKCNTLVHISVGTCPSCGFVFPVTTKLRTSADTVDVIRRVAPVDNWLRVDRVTYEQYTKRSTGASSLLVTYYCAGTPFREWVHFGGHQYTRYRASQWWAARSMSNPPNTLASALERINELSSPKHIVVERPKHFFEITKIKF